MADLDRAGGRRDPEITHEARGKAVGPIDDRKEQRVIAEAVGFEPAAITR